jgi:hypothetical protein
MTSLTASGWEIITTWEASTSVVVAPGGRFFRRMPRRRGHEGGNVDEADDVVGLRDVGGEQPFGHPSPAGVGEGTVDENYGRARIGHRCGVPVNG